MIKQILNGEEVEVNDEETYDNGVKVVPSYLLVPYVITKDSLDKLVDTGLYKWIALISILNNKAFTV